MFAYWTSIDDEYLNVEAEVVRCVQNDGVINIIFKSSEEGNVVEGRLSIAACDGVQKSEGLWRYPDSKKENSRFSETQQESNEEEIIASIEGELKGFTGTDILFVGTWIDKSGQCEGHVYEFEIDAIISN